MTIETPIRYTGGDGGSQAEAIVILDAPNHRAGVEAEYGYLTRRFGEQGADWERIEQSLLHEGDRRLDRMVIRLRDGREQTLYFDTTAFFGNFDLPGPLGFLLKLLGGRKNT